MLSLKSFRLLFLLFSLIFGGDELYNNIILFIIRQLFPFEINAMIFFNIEENIFIKSSYVRYSNVLIKKFIS